MTYSSLERLRSYLYKVSFDAIPPDGGTDSRVGGGCTSYVMDGKLYRNLDWDYNETASFWVVCPRFEGMAFLDGLNDGFDPAQEDNRIGQLPYHIADGVNNHGIMVATHVLYNDWNWQGSGGTPLYKLPFLILQNVAAMETLESSLAQILPDLYRPAGLGDYLLQILVTDGETTMVIQPPEDAEGSYEVVDATQTPKLANFRWLNKAAVSRSELQNRPTGVERWNLAPTDMDRLRFTDAYRSATRLSEFIGLRDTTKSSTDAELIEIYNVARGLFLNRERDGRTWHTMHSVVYSTKGLESLYVQEDFTEDYAKVTEKVSTYTYDPTRINDGGKDQLRFELGDTVVDMGGISAVLCDEEYAALLERYAGKWRRARFEALQAIVMKLSYEVNTSVGGLSYSLDQRYQRWKKMLDDERKAMTAIGGVPIAGDPSSLSPYGGTPYFYNDMQANRRRWR